MGVMSEIMEIRFCALKNPRHALRTWIKENGDLVLC